MIKHLIFMKISIFCMLIFSCSLYGQKGIDTSKLSLCYDQLQEVLNFQDDVNKKRLLSTELNKNFCLLNFYDTEKATELLLFYFENSFINKGTTYGYIRDDFDCLTVEQVNLVRNKLKQNINSEDKYFFELVSLYQLTQFKAHLKQSIITQDLFKSLKEDLLKGKISDSIKIQMKSMAVLSNLGDANYEDEILNSVKELYAFISSEKRRLIPRFYTEVLPNSLALLNTKKSVVESLYLLEDKNLDFVVNDISTTDFSFDYFLIVVEPKLKGFKLKRLAWVDLDGNREKIKVKLLNDESIWLDHIIVHR